MQLIERVERIMARHWALPEQKREEAAQRIWDGIPRIDCGILEPVEPEGKSVLEYLAGGFGYFVVFVFFGVLVFW